jgi:hypothetical protein
MVTGFFEWLAEQWPGSYGLMYIRPEHPGVEGWCYHVQKIGHGRVEYLEDRYFLDRDTPLG